MLFIVNRFLFIIEKTSKRIPAKRRYKIEKRVKEHSRKLRKESRKNPSFKKKQKLVEIPNSLPFKEKIIDEVKEHQKQAEEQKKALKKQLKQNLIDGKNKKASGITDLNALVKDAEMRGQQFDSRPAGEPVHVISEGETSNLKTFYKEFKKVVEASDVIIEVLDARDPLGTRCFDVENLVRKESPDKKIILLLNKVDLIPRPNAEQWLKYLRNEFPTILFKASTQSQKSNLARSKSNILLVEDDLLKTSRCFGGDDLLKLLNKYCHNKDIKTSISVGVVGMPNVGKSSLINSLKRTHVCNVGAMPGLTRNMQSISLDKHIKLIDSPGVVFVKNPQGGNDQISTILALRNAVNIDSLNDPIQPVEALLNRVNKQELIAFYRLTEFSDVKQFLSLVAKRFGKMLKGGILDLHATAKKVLHDWNCGKIKYFSVPPERADTIDTQIVYQIAKEFDINDYEAPDDSMETD